MIKHLYFITIVIFLALFSCSINGKTPEVLNLTIKDGEYIQNIDEFNSITINFNVPMNRYITETGISIDGYYGDIHFAWANNGKTCVLNLSEVFEPGKSYTLKVDKSCESENGIDLGREVRVKFYTYSGTDNFTVLSTSPSDGSTRIDSNISEITVDFSLPIKESSIYDKINISPDIRYYYSYSQDYRSLFISPAESLEKNTVYQVTVKKGFLSQTGKVLEKECSFSFSTVYSTEDFNLSEVVMVDKGLGPSDPHIDINTDYLAETGGIDKDMELILIFSSDYYLTELEDHFTIEPYIGYKLTKENGYTRVIFDADMKSEEKYTVFIDDGFKDINGIPLNRDYKFLLVIDGDRSKNLKVLSIYIKDPNGINDTLIFKDGAYFQNEAMLYQTKVDHQEVQFEIDFSSPINVYQALDKIALNFMFGNAEATSGEMVDYSWSETNNVLLVTFSIPIINSSEDAYYKFVVNGGDEGILDTDDNPLAEDISVYTIYNTN